MNSPAVTYVKLEESPQRLWQEWLAGFFDGGPHLIGPSGTESVTFPQASISFDQAELPQPLDGSGVSGLNILVLSHTTDDATYLTENGKFVCNDVKWDFFVRAGNAAFGQGNPQYQCRLATQLLRACLLNDHAIKPLAEKGMFDLAVSESEPILSTLYQLRRIIVRGRLEYEFQTI